MIEMDGLKKSLRIAVITTTDPLIRAWLLDILGETGDEVNLIISRACTAADIKITAPCLKKYFRSQLESELSR